jgi:hypothetical protein
MPSSRAGRKQAKLEAALNLYFQLQARSNHPKFSHHVIIRIRTSGVRRLVDYFSVENCKRDLQDILGDFEAFFTRVDPSAAFLDVTRLIAEAGSKLPQKSVSEKLREAYRLRCAISEQEEMRKEETDSGRRTILQSDIDRLWRRLASVEN